MTDTPAACVVAALQPRQASDATWDALEPVHLGVTRWASLTPAAAAVTCADQRLTYLELDGASNALARRLIRVGVGAGDIIGVCLERSVELVVAIVAVLKSGAAYVPFDPDYPAARLDDMRQDANVRVIVTTQGVASRLDFGAARILIVDVGDLDSEEVPPLPAVSLEDLAYVIFTSGSTGRPKGVMVSHANLAYSTAARLDYYRAPATRYLLLSSVAFDSSVAGLFWTLCSGGCLVLPAPGTERDSAQLASLIESEAVTHVLALPSLYRLLLGQHPTRSLASLEVVIVAGEACPAVLVGEHRRRLPSTSFFNEYGPTEATVWCTVYEVAGDWQGARLPIGVAIAGAVVHILAPDGSPVIPGESGELYVGGPGVSRGYLNRPDLTAERFVADRVGNGAGGRLYRTGDLGRRLPDGSIDFLGRLDQQVKIRGYRIELGEIESRLTDITAVEHAAAVVREAANGDRQLVAYVQPRAGHAPTAGTLGAALALVLPDFMLPSRFVFMAALPRSANGKVDRSALPEVSRDRPDLQQAYVAPRTPLEAWLVAVWADELQLDRVGIHDRFFELGGDSMRAARMVSRLQDCLGEFVFVVLIFAHPTIDGLAAVLRRQYRAAVAREFGETAGPDPILRTEPLRAEDFGRARALVASYVRRIHTPAIRARRAVFLLSPPRSGTTLLAAMLAGHPDIFAASELNLMGFDTLDERRAAYSGARSLWREGAIRALMAVEHLSTDEAAAEMVLAENAGRSTLAFFA
ncbi:MAG: amino acid adenylation domain-containing protein, partial [Acidobacteriota bacterium]